MAKLIYAALASLDGYTADKDGGFGWAEPDKEVFKAVNDILRPVGTHLYGRRMYEVMVAWETMHTLPDQPAFAPGTELPEREFARMWRAANKIVYSKSLKVVSSAKTHIERAFDPELIRQMKARAESNITVAGPNLAAQAIKAGLVDEYRLFVNPVVVGGGKRWLPMTSC
jgi:dihydrofolate reductase